MTGLVVAAAAFVASVVAAGVVYWLAERLGKTCTRVPDSALRAYQRRLDGSVPVTIPWTQVALRALAFASYTSMGIYLPAAGWEDDHTTCVLEDAQVVLATVESNTLVLDLLVPGDFIPPRDRRLRVPFTLCARLPRREASQPLPPSLDRWSNTGVPVDVWIGQRGDVPFVRLIGGDSRLTLALLSPPRRLGQPPGQRAAQQ